MIAYHLASDAIINFDALSPLYDQLRRIGKQDRIDLWIHSHGGRTEVPVAIVRTIRRFCHQFGVLVPLEAQSGATHIAMGADEIIMGPFARLSPVDPSRTHPLLPPGTDGKPLSISVQDLKHAVAFIRREAGGGTEEVDENAGNLGDEAYAQIISVLFDKVHPLALGAIEQSYNLAKLISRRLLETHMDPVKEASKIKAIVDEMSDGFSSHLYPIGIEDAVRIGLKVARATDELADAMMSLLFYYQAMDRSPQEARDVTVIGAQAVGKLFVHRIGHLDSTDLRSDCLNVTEQTQAGLQGRGATWQLLQAG